MRNLNGKVEVTLSIEIEVLLQKPAHFSMNAFTM